MKRPALALLFALLAPGAPGASDLDKPPSPDREVAAADAALMASDIAQLAPQRPGHPDLFVLGMAGDGSEQVFENEVRFLRDLAGQRLDARGHVLLLANHPPQPPQRPLPRANLANLRAALKGLGAAMDRDEDVLLLYLTTHGTPEHELLLRRPGAADDLLEAGQIRQALEAAGIRHRVIVLSACFSGGLIPALQGPDTLVLTAARHDRTSFGCGNDSVATYFGRAWLVDGLNATPDFDAAFALARTAIAERERADDLTPSRPQIARGERIGARLSAWLAGLSLGPPLPYPHAEPQDDEDEARGFIFPPLPGDTSH